MSVSAIALVFEREKEVSECYCRVKHLSFLMPLRALQVGRGTDPCSSLSEPFPSVSAPLRTPQQQPTFDKYPADLPEHSRTHREQHDERDDQRQRGA